MNTPSVIPVMLTQPASTPTLWNLRSRPACTGAEVHFKTSAGINQSVKLDNHAVLGGKWDASDDMTLQDMKGGGYVSQSKLVVHKVDSANQANGLKNAKFSLHWFNPTTSSWETTAKQHFTNDEAGKFTIYIGDEDLEAKHDTLYKLVEEAAPERHREKKQALLLHLPLRR